MIDWFFATLRQYPEIAIFLSLGIGYYVGKFTFKGIGLGSVTATLLAAVVIGQLGITVNQPLKAFAFLMFLFAVGYGVGPQFVRGVAKDGLPQALYAVVVCLLCLASGVLIPKLAGYDLGYAAGLYAGAQTISASMGLATDAINRLGLAADQTKAMLDNMPVAYAVTYLFGTVGSAIVIGAAAHRSGRRRQGLRGEAGWRRQGSRRGGLGLAPLGAARLPRATGREGRWPPGRRGRGPGAQRAGLRRAHPPQGWDDRGRHRRQRDPRGRRGRGRRAARGSRQGDRGERPGGR
jgi:putative transport protein